MAKRISQPKEITFSQQDFGLFGQEQRRDREYNKSRLRVRRKLGDLGAFALPALKNVGLSLVLRTSLHHPYSFNRYAVDSQWVYFAPAPEEYRELQEHVLGKYLGEDLDFHYTHTLLLVGIQSNGLFISLKIHPNAWWDGQNLKNKCGHAEHKMVLWRLCQELKNFSLKLHDWPNRHPCAGLTLETLGQYFQYYTPGDHWFHLDYEVPKENPIATSPAFTNLATEQLLALIPVYRFLVWKPDNNFVFQKNAVAFGGEHDA
jgi:hypothetical protein